MKIIIFVLIIILILILILPNKKANNKNIKSGCGCNARTEEYDNSASPQIYPVIQYVISTPTCVDIFSIYNNLKTFGWEFATIPGSSPSSSPSSSSSVGPSSSVCVYKPKSSSDVTDHIYGKIAMKHRDSNNNVLRDENGNSRLLDPSDNIYTKIGNNLPTYINKNAVASSTVRLFNVATQTFIYVNTKNQDIASLIAQIEAYKKELYENYIHN